MALTQTPDAELGKPCPDFDLPAVNGRSYRRQDIPAGRPFVVMFICNHCPYVKAIEDRLITLGHDLSVLDVPVYAICSNDARIKEEDSFENLRKRWQDKKYSFPYLHDESQSVARAFGAVCTPDFFVYDKDGRLAYRGRLDDSWKEPGQVTRRDLFEATRQLALGLKLSGKQTPSMGCSIKWKED